MPSECERVAEERTLAGRLLTYFTSYICYLLFVCLFLCDWNKLWLDLDQILSQRSLWKSEN